MARTKNFGDVIRKEIAQSAELAEAVEQESFNADIATKIYLARTEAGFSQEELARRVGTRQSVIARLENADYYLRTLKRIADALGKTLRIEFYSKRMALDEKATEKPTKASPE